MITNRDFYCILVYIFAKGDIPQAFTGRHTIMIKEAVKRYMDDGFVLWPVELNINILIDILGKLYGSIKYTVEGKVEGNKQSINFLDTKVILYTLFP